MRRIGLGVHIFIIILFFLLFSPCLQSHELFGTVDIHGFISQGYLWSDKNNFLAETKDGSFQFNEMGINFNTSVSDDLRMGIQFFARDLGENGNDEIVIDWALADYHFRDWMGLRVGKVKKPYGLYNEVRDMDMLRTQVLMPQAIYAELYRDIYNAQKGLSIYGDILAGSVGRFSYTLFHGTVNASKESGMTEAYENQFSDLELGVTRLAVGNMSNWGITWHMPIEGLRTKIYMYHVNRYKISGLLNSPLADELGFDYVSAETQPTGYTFSIEYTKNTFMVTGEVLYYKNDIKIDLGSGYESLPSVEGLGWYVSAFYRFKDLLEIGYTYAEFFPDINNRDGKDTYPSNDYFDEMGIAGNRLMLRRDFMAWLISQTVSTRFNINRHWLFKLEVTYNDGFGAYTSAENDTSDLSRYWLLYAAKVTYTF